MELDPTLYRQRLDRQEYDVVIFLDSDYGEICMTTKVATCQQGYPRVVFRVKKKGTNFHREFFRAEEAYNYLELP